MAFPSRNAFRTEKDGPGQARSSALNPLQWMTGICMGGLTSLLAASASNWIVITVVGMLALVFTTFLVAYIYFMLNDADALRSEGYGLTKHEMDLRYKVFGRDETIVAFMKSKSKPKKAVETVGLTKASSEDRVVPIKFYEGFLTRDWPALPTKVQDALVQFLQELQKEPLNEKLPREVQKDGDYWAYEFSPEYAVYWNLANDSGEHEIARRINVVAVEKLQTAEGQNKKK